MAQASTIPIERVNLKFNKTDGPCLLTYMVTKTKHMHTKSAGLNENYMKCNAILFIFDHHTDGFNDVVVGASIVVEAVAESVVVDVLRTVSVFIDCVEMFAGSGVVSMTLPVCSSKLSQHAMSLK